LNSGVLPGATVSEILLRDGREQEYLPLPKLAK